MIQPRLGRDWIINFALSELIYVQIVFCVKKDSFYLAASRRQAKDILLCALCDSVVINC